MRAVSPRAAHKVLSENPKAILVDVRSQAEYQFVGHPLNACNIPMTFWNPARYDFEPNPRFAADLTARFAKDVPLLFICRSGGRSEKAAREAVALGFGEVYNVTEGFEGETDSQGLRTINGWKNSGLPYTYEVKEELRYQGP
ncbi:MAG: hypothetical protein A2Z06_03880 [Candidatus Glassbacteria bacterium RBG_16_58_8]|uniref:Rhodanese domain-containing protein n=1 Tax=Candidatus Glassbacteria bacterium RBG_16_58_8 TaxID=1817866 RepID=A0A1F5YB82_9BACT|nr:MAG: hypothetical protein A2Z06_03880 [Candidatus Glassbacteria bacterium RBG_16_58_8]